MIDYNKYTYTKIGSYANVVVQNDKESQPYQVDLISIHPLIEPVIHHAALHHADWTLLGVSFSRGDHQATAFEVLCDGVAIGSIRREPHRGKIEIRNSRIENARIRRGGSLTSDYRKAIKTMEKHFGAKTIGEVCSQARQDAQSTIYSKKWNTQQDYDALMAGMRDALAAYVLQNMEHARPALISLGVAEASIDSLADTVEASKVACDIGDPNKLGMVIALYQDKYLLIDNDAAETQSLAAGEIDPDVRAKLGMLKLCNVGDPIVDVGIRVSDKTFYIVK